MNNALTQKLSYLTKVRLHESQDQTPWGLSPTTMPHTKIIREGGQTESGNTLWTLTCFLCVFQTVKANFSILRGPLLQTFRTNCYVEHFKESEFKNFAL